ncbi:MAG: hypothetical protein NTY73_02495 [Candidatus Micrarchaeota archaeon]|nr:hypothetical protein [Candidatus Micrarchaeota archaeon]
MKLRIVTFMLAALLIFGCVSYTPPAEQPTNQTNVTPVTVFSCADIKDAADGDKCYFNDAITKNNLTSCSFIFSTQVRDNCNLIFAINLNDSSLCGRINVDSTRDDCYHTLAPRVGIATCNKIESDSLRRQCRLELGDDTVYCENMTAGYDSKLCMAKARGNYSICLELNNISLIDNCYIDFAKNNGSYQLCNLPSDSNLRDDCFKYFAFLESNSSLCEKISVVYQKYLCLTKITNNYTLCNELTDYLQRDSCLELFASEHMNYSLCSNISTHLYQDRCYTDVAFKSGNANICSYITCYECITDKDNCYYQVANVTADVSICSRIAEQYKRDNCVLDVAKSAHNPAACSNIENAYRKSTCFTIVMYNQPYATSACDGITQQTWKDECYKNAAITNKNSTICNGVSDPFLKKDCIRDSV